MTFEQALAIVEGEFETRYVAPDARAIRVNRSYDGYSMLYIELYDGGDRIILSDGGMTKEHFYKVTDEEWGELCRENGFEFNRRHIERRFISLSDVYAIIDFLISICDKYDPISDERLNEVKEHLAGLDMKRAYLIAVDLEGVHGVVGERYDKLIPGHKDYDLAVEAATLEVNTAVSALYDSGAELVAVWDNHGGGGNLDFGKIDPRVKKIDARGDKYRFDFVRDYAFRAILFIGYHAMEGTPNAVLAHTFNSVGIQYARLDGLPVGELAVDTYICDGYGIKPIFLASDDVCIDEMRRIREDISAVVTKIGRGRNRAELRDRSEVLAEIYDGVCRAVELDDGYSFPFPKGAELEVRYTRAEAAEDVYNKITENGEMPVRYGADTHTLHFRVSRANQMPCVL